MKILLFVLAVMLCLPMVVSAESESLSISNLIEKLPEVQTGLAYSVIDQDWNPSVSAPIIKGKGKFDVFSLNIGAVAKEFDSQESNEGVLGTLGISYDVVALKEYVDIPVLDLIGLKVEAYAGIPILDTLNGDIGDSAEFDWGVMFKVLSIDI